MYLFKIVEKILAQEEKEEKIEVLKQDNSFLHNPLKASKQNVVQNNHQNDNRITEKTQDNIENTAYCLFANSGQSFLAKNNQETITIYLNGINNPDKFSQISKSANKAINELIKGKVVYLANVIQKDNTKDIIADVFIDKNKRQSVNDMLIAKGLGMSSIEEKKDLQSISDMKVVEDLGYQIPNVITKTKDKEVNNTVTNNNTNTNTNNNNTNSNNTAKQVSHVDTFDSIIGYLKKSGRSPYLHEKGNNTSFYVTIEKNNKETTKWGVDLQRALAEANVEVGDYIRIFKDKKNYTQNSKKTAWAIEKIDDIEAIYAKTDGPPLNNVPIEDPVLDSQLYGYQEPPNWEEYPMDTSYYEQDFPSDETIMSIHDTMHFTQQFEEPIMQEAIIQEPVIQEPIMPQPIIQEPVMKESIMKEPDVVKNVKQEITSSVDLMDDILAALDEPSPKKTLKLNNIKM